jgi:hypothetical protein
VNRVESAGRHEVAWDGRDSRGLPVGIYIVKLSAGSQHAKAKLIALGK